jgi:hypothetical protein
MQNDTRGVHLTTPEGLTLTLQPED